MKSDIKNLFSKQSTFHMFIALKLLADSERPLGSWTMKERMESRGGEISLASVGRLLKELDILGFTELVPGQGRMLTQLGFEQLEAMQSELERKKIEAEMKDAAKFENKQDIIKLLQVRKIIEPEVVKLIVKEATDHDIEQLARSVEMHQCGLAKSSDVELLPINFHQVLSDLSCNRFLNAVLKLLIHEELCLESQFPSIAAKLREAHHLAEHELILSALKDRNAELAVHYTKQHIQKLIDSITD